VFGMLEIVLAAVLLIVLPWFLAVTDILKSEFKGSDRLTLFLLIGIPIIGPVLYLVYGKKMKTNQKTD
jgi:hypothetical protein